MLIDDSNDHDGDEYGDDDNDDAAKIMREKSPKSLAGGLLIEDSKGVRAAAWNFSPCTFLHFLINVVMTVEMIMIKKLMMLMQ